MPQPRRFRITTTERDAGKPLSEVLGAHLKRLSPDKIGTLIEIGGVFIDRKRVKDPHRLILKGEQIETTLGGALLRAARATQAVPPSQSLAGIRFHHTDSDLVVVEKPSGMLSAPTPESDRNNLLAALMQEYGRVFLIHRLDLETSGLLVFARTPDANRALSERFRTHDVHRVYLAVLHGQIASSHTVDRPISDKRAVTHFEPLESFESATLVRCKLETGRTHQIRIHAQHLGHFVLGDPRYGGRTGLRPPRLALHAAELGFVHPTSGAALRFEAPWPDDMASWIQELRGTVAAPP